MRRTHYTKYKGDLASEIDLEDLLQGLAGYFLNSGFQDPYSQFHDLEQSLDAHERIYLRIKAAHIGGGPQWVSHGTG